MNECTHGGRWRFRSCAIPIGQDWLVLTVLTHVVRVTMVGGRHILQGDHQ